LLGGARRGRIRPPRRPMRRAGDPDPITPVIWLTRSSVAFRGLPTTQARDQALSAPHSEHNCRRPNSATRAGRLPGSVVPAFSPSRFSATSHLVRPATARYDMQPGCFRSTGPDRTLSYKRVAATRAQNRDHPTAPDLTGNDTSLGTSCSTEVIQPVCERRG
jgi:hypothetical protein